MRSSRILKAFAGAVGFAALYAAEKWDAKKTAEWEKQTGKKAWKPFAMQSGQEQMETVEDMKKGGCEDVARFYGPTGTPFVTCMKWKQPAPAAHGKPSETSENSFNHVMKKWAAR